jgi:hypothetical protein
VERLIAHLARAGLPVVPVSITEQDGLLVRFGKLLPPAELLEEENPAEFVLRKIRSS